MADPPSNRVQTLRDLLGHRPAETGAAATGAVGLILASLFGHSEELIVGLVVLLSVLPAIISYFYDLARGSRRSLVRVDDELQALTLRAIRRVRVDDPRWESDLDAIKRIGEAVKGSPPGTNDSDDGDTSPPGPTPEEGAS